MLLHDYMIKKDHKYLNQELYPLVDILSQVHWI